MYMEKLSEPEEEASEGIKDGPWGSHGADNSECSHQPGWINAKFMDMHQNTQKSLASVMGIN